MWGGRVLFNLGGGLLRRLLPCCSPETCAPPPPPGLLLPSPRQPQPGEGGGGAEQHTQREWGWDPPRSAPQLRVSAAAEWGRGGAASWVMAEGRMLPCPSRYPALQPRPELPPHSHHCAQTPSPSPALLTVLLSVALSHGVGSSFMVRSNPGTSWAGARQRGSGVGPGAVVPGGGPARPGPARHRGAEGGTEGRARDKGWRREWSGLEREGGAGVGPGGRWVPRAL